MKPWEKYKAKEGSGRAQEPQGPWTRYRGSSQGSEAFQKAVQRETTLMPSGNVLI